MAPVRRPSLTNLSDSAFHELSSQTMMAMQLASQSTSIRFSVWLSAATSSWSARRKLTQSRGVPRGELKSQALQQRVARAGRPARGGRMRRGLPEV